MPRPPPSRRSVPGWSGCTSKREAIQADLLLWDPAAPFDAIYDQTCLCALPPAIWPEYAARLHRWLRPGGALFILFMQSTRAGGPPFHCDLGQMRVLFAEHDWIWPETLPATVAHSPGIIGATGGAAEALNEGRDNGRRLRTSLADPHAGGARQLHRLRPLRRGLPDARPGRPRRGRRPGIAAGVLAILRGEAPPDASARWASVCSGSGHCIPACQHGVNPRFMLTMARLAMQRRNDAATRRKDGFARFAGMTTGVRVLSRLQLPPELLARFRPDDDEPDDAPPDVVFYTGCNLLKTPHIALLCFDIMDAMGLRYRVMGGPSHCCGVLQFRAGDLATSGRIAYRTMERLGSARRPRADLVPDLPGAAWRGGGARPGRPAVDLTPFLLFLAERLDDLRPLLRHPVAQARRPARTPRRGRRRRRRPRRSCA